MSGEILCLIYMAVLPLVLVGIYAVLKRTKR